MLFASQHSLIIKIFMVREKWGGGGAIAPLFRRHCIGTYYNYVIKYTAKTPRLLIVLSAGALLIMSRVKTAVCVT